MAGEPASCLPPQHSQGGWSLHHWASGIILEGCAMPVSLPMGPPRVQCGCSISALGQAAVVGNTLRCWGHHWQGHTGLIRQFHGSKICFLLLNDAQTCGRSWGYQPSWWVQGGLGRAHLLAPQEGTAVPSTPFNRYPLARDVFPITG